MGKTKNERFLERIALRVKELRDERGITQEVFYNDTGIELNKNIVNADKNAVLKFNASYVALNNIKNKNYFFIVDGNVGRLHTNLTGVKSGLRNFITYSGKSMVSIDIVNSQPFLSSLILDEKFYENQPNQQKNQQNGGKFG